MSAGDGKQKAEGGRMKDDLALRWKDEGGMIFESHLCLSAAKIRFTIYDSCFAIM
jgi:hypothetical protein